MLFASHTHKIMFIAVPKTGTRSIARFLKAHFNATQVKSFPRGSNGYFTFATVRNPYDRACSQWWSTCMRGNDKRGNLAEFKRRGLPNHVNSWLEIRERSGKGSQAAHLNGRKIDQILRFESLNDDFNMLPFVTRRVTIERLNTTIDVRQPWEEIIDVRTVELVNTMYADDFRYVDYPMIEDFDEWKRQNG